MRHNVNDLKSGQGQLTSHRRVPGVRLAWTVVGAVLLASVGAVGAQPAGGEDKVVALKQSLQTGLAELKKYEWVETTTISIKGEQKSETQNRCYYGVDGQVQKIPYNPAAQKKAPRGIRGKVVKNKKEGMADYMEAAVALVKQYVPPDPARIQAVKEAGKMSISMLAPDRHRFQFGDYFKTGDVLSVDLDPTTNRLLELNVASYLDKPDDAVHLNVTMTTLADGALYASKIVLNGESKKIIVEVQNTGHRLAAPGQ
jgi:hypothetical protein